MKRKLSLVTAIALSVTMLMAGCSKDNGGTKVDVKDAEALNSSIIATIDDMEFSQADYNVMYNMIYQNMSQYAMYYGEDWENEEIEEGKKVIDAIKEGADEQIKQMAGIIKLAEDNDIKADSKEIKESIKTQKENLISQSFGGEAGYKEFLESAHTTDEAFTKYITVSEVYRKLYKEQTKHDGVARKGQDKWEKEFLDANKDKWYVQHILVSTKAETDQEGKETKPAKTDEEAKNIVKEIYAKLNNGEDFDALIEEYNEDPGMKKGSFYLFGTGEMVPEFEEATKNLEIGQYTKEAVKTDYGYHIIKRYEINKDIKEFKDFETQKMQEASMKLVEKKIKSLKTEFKDDTIKAYLDKWAKERKAEADKAKKEAEAEAEKQSDSEAPAEVEAPVEGEAPAESEAPAEKADSAK